jgi:hypothetical protein
MHGVVGFGWMRLRRVESDFHLQEHQVRLRRELHDPSARARAARRATRASRRQHCGVGGWSRVLLVDVLLNSIRTHFVRNRVMQLEGRC